MKEFKGLLKSEVKKAERLANKLTGFKDCRVTAYSSEVTHPFDFDPESTWIQCICEICRDYEEPIDFSVNLSIPMRDRRKSFAWCVYNGEYTE